MVKVYFKTFGCPTNFAESEAMQELLKKADFEIVDKPEKAFVIVLNICTVKGDTVPLREIRKAREFPYKKLIIAGCITNDIIPKIKEIDREASIINTHNIHDIISVMEETINDNPIDVLTKNEKPEEKIDLPKPLKKPIAIMPICSGCTGECSYCSVRIVKGELVSYTMEKIVDQCRKLAIHGAKEIWITAQDTASYMLDKNEKTQLPELIQKISELPGDFKIRIGMMNINNIIPVMDEMIEAMKSEKVFKFLHLPLQSGSDEVLERMKRKYTAEEFKAAVKKLKEGIPNLTISTDIICGFPGETEEDFKKSSLMIDDIKPDVLNVSKFRPRPGTEAAEMEDQVPGEAAKERSKSITSLFEWSSYHNNKQWLGWTGEVIIDEVGKEGTNTMIGRNPSYKPVIIDNPENNLKIGDIKKVKITAYSKHDLKGDLI